MPHEETVRHHLPIPDSPYTGPSVRGRKDPEATFPPIEPLRPPAGARNVLIVLLEDVGFAASSAFGGPCATPTAERLAANGLKLSRFHTVEESGVDPCRAATRERRLPLRRMSRRLRLDRLRNRRYGQRADVQSAAA